MKNMIKSLIAAIGVALMMTGSAFAGTTVATEAELKAAVAAGGEITLGADISLAETLSIPTGATVELDLNGKTVSHTDEANKYAINNLGTLTLKDSKGNGSINARGIYNGYGNGGDNVATAKITVESGTYNAKGTNGGAAIFNYGEAYINGGSFTSIGGYSLNNQAGSSMTIADGVTANNGIYCSNANVTVNGGNISGNRSGCHVVYAWNAELTINGGTFYNNNSGNATIMSAGTTKCTITGGTFGIKDGRVEGNGNTFTSCLTDTANTATMAVTGGTFNGGFRVQAGTTMIIEGGSYNDCYGSKYNIYGTVTVKGGTFTDDTAKTFADNNLADGYELGANGQVVAKPVAQIGETTYTTLAEALAAAQAGDEIVLLDNVTLSAELTLPAGIKFNGNGKQINGSIVAAGNLEFVGLTKITSFNAGYNKPTITIGAGACLEMNGTGRMVIGHGATFNITGTVADAKTADKSTLTPSLVMPGASFTGAGVTFNVNNAYIKTTASYCSSSKSASGTFDFNINNSIWEQFGKLAFEAQSTAATVNFELKDSVLNTGSHLVFGVAAGEVVIDNSNVNVGKRNQIENRSTMTIKNGSIVNGAVATSSNAINPGTVIVENATYDVTGQFSGAAVGTGTLVIKNGANVSVGSIVDKANIQIDATGMTAGNEINLTANLSKFAGTVEVINNDNLDASIVDGKIVLSAKPVAKIGDTPYATLEEAVDAAQNGDTVTVLADVSDVIVEVAKNITISGSVTMNNVGINAVGATEMTVGGLTFTGNSWINCGTATKLTVFGVTANVTPSNKAYTNSRSTFISLGRSEQHSLELVVENCNIVSKGGSNPILGWASIVKATITGSVFGSESAYQSNSDSIKFMGIADGAEFSIRNNKFYSNYNGIVFGQNVTRDNSYSVVLDGNEFFGGADHIWVEITAGEVCHATIKASSNNTVNGNPMVAGDIKARTGVIKSWSSYAGVDIVVDAEGKVVGGTLAFYAADAIAEGYEVSADGAVAEIKVASIGTKYYASFASALAAAQDGDTISLLADVELAGTVTIAKSIAIEGNGKRVTTADGFAANGSNAMIDLVKNVTFGNIVFDGVKNVAVMRSVGGDIVMDQCVVKNCIQTVSQGLLRLACCDATITDCQFVDNTCTMVVSFGYDAANDDDVLLIDGCSFERNTCKETAVVYMADGDYGKVTDTLFADNNVSSAGNAATLYMGWSDGSEVSGCTFKDNTVVTSHATTKRFASAIFCDGCVVGNNAFIGNTATRNGEAIATIVAVGAYYGAANISANYWGKAEPEAGVDFTVEYTRQDVAYDSYYATIDGDGNLGNLVEFVARIGVAGYDSIDDALAAAKNADTVVLLADATIQNEYAVENMSLTIAGDAKLTFNDKLKVKGESTLDISAQTSGDVWLDDGAILKDSAINGTVFVAGNVLFRGANTVKMVYDYGVLTDYYGTSAPMCWTVEPGASLVITDKARYGLGYGDQVTIKGNLSDAMSARSELTDADASLVMHGLVAQESKGWNKDSSLTVNSAYVRIGDNNSFGNKPGNYGGAYQFKFVNSVLDASRITFYEALSTTEFLFKDSDVKMGTFMTRDADSVFTLDDTVLLSTATSNGSDEGNYHAGKLVLSNNSRLTYSAEWKVEATGVVEMDATCSITAPMISGTGKIVIDARTVADIEKQVIFADMTGFTGAIEVVGGDTYQIVDTGVIIRRPAAYAYFDGYYYDTFKDAFDAAVESDMGNISIGVLGDSVVDYALEIPAGKSIVLDLGGKTLAKADGAKIVVDNAIVKFANGTLSGFSASDVEIKGDSVATFPANTVDLADFADSFYKTTNEDGSVSVATKFRSFIQVESGVPYIGFLKNATSEYKVYGKLELTDADWTLVEMVVAEDVVSDYPALPLKWFVPAMDTFRFFKVEMVEEK